jgi:phosphoglycerate dehydrogenase-like enzyme
MFVQPAASRVAPTFYSYREPRYIERLAHRLGRAGAPRLTLDHGADVSDVTALWLGAAVELSGDEMANLVARLPCLTWVYSQRTGTDHLPLELFRSRGIAVSNTGDLTSLWVAEMHLACMLSHAKQLSAHEAMQRRHVWRALSARDLGEMSVLVIGTGTIGGHTARLCRGVGMHVVGASRTPARWSGATHDYDAVVGLDEALRESITRADVVVLAVPLTAETRGMISADVLGRMRQNAALLNLARPTLVDERALVAALRAGTVGAAWVSRTEELRWWERRRADLLPTFHLTHMSEANVESKLKRACEQFTSLAERQSLGEVGNRVA